MALQSKTEQWHLLVPNFHDLSTRTLTSKVVTVKDNTHLYIKERYNINKTTWTELTVIAVHTQEALQTVTKQNLPTSAAEVHRRR